MKKWKIVLLTILGMLVIGAAAVAIWQWDNIRAVITVLTRDSGDIAGDLEQQRQEHQKELEDKRPITVKPPSTQQDDDVFSGTTTPEKVKDELGITEQIEKGKEAGIIPSEDQPDSTEPGPGTESGDTSREDENPPNESGKQQLTADELLNICVAELYACKVDIMDTLRGLKEEALAEWRSLSPEERTAAKKREIGFKGLDKCYDLEVATDRKVHEILDRYRPLLEELEEDTSILTVLWKQYLDEKSAEKAYYLDKYMP